MLRMIGRKHRSLADRGQHRGAGVLDQRDAAVPGILLPRAAAEQEQRILRCRDHVGQRRNLRFGGRRRGRRAEAARIGDGNGAIELLLLQAGVETHVDRAVRRRRRHLVGLQHALDDRFRRARLVVPFREVAQQRALILGGVNPIDPRPPLVGRDRPRRAERQNRHPVAPGVEDAHQAVHQADIAVQDARHRLVGDLGIAVRDRDDMILVQTQQHLRRAIAEIVHQAVVKSAIARAGIERHVFDVQLAQHLGCDVARPAHVVGRSIVHRSFKLFHVLLTAMVEERGAMRQPRRRLVELTRDQLSGLTPLAFTSGSQGCFP